MGNRRIRYIYQLIAYSITLIGILSIFTIDFEQIDASDSGGGSDDDSGGGSDDDSGGGSDDDSGGGSDDGSGGGSDLPPGFGDLGGGSGGGSGGGCAFGLCSGGGGSGNGDRRGANAEDIAGSTPARPPPPGDIAGGGGPGDIGGGRGDISGSDNQGRFRLNTHEIALELITLSPQELKEYPITDLTARDIKLVFDYLTPQYLAYVLLNISEDSLVEIRNILTPVTFDGILQRISEPYKSQIENRFPNTPLT
jgi:hypothetical protein